MMREGSFHESVCFFKRLLVKISKLYCGKLFVNMKYPPLVFITLDELNELYRNVIEIFVVH